ncbi:MAG: hypothetical protein QOJ63_2757 [Solirubrobacteraceae bacterium]|jgi:hypothetical protein|nr:hypothetical protein [Solirubrobacteraceae bacterium]
MADEEATPDGEDALAGDADITSGEEVSGGGDLPDDGIQGTEDEGTEGDPGEGAAGPASGTTEGDDAVGVV